MDEPSGDRSAADGQERDYTKQLLRDLRTHAAQLDALRWSPEGIKGCYPSGLFTLILAFMWGAGDISPVAAVLLFLLWFALLFAVGKYLVRWGNRLYERARNSGILEQLAMGHSQLPDIDSAAPVPFRWLFLPRRRDKMRDAVILVGKHLEWYLRPTRYYLPLEWVWLLMKYAVVAGIVCSIPFIPYFDSRYIGYIALFAIVLLQGQAFQGWRQTHGVFVLINCLEHRSAE
jgi:hypothetical protein